MAKTSLNDVGESTMITATNASVEIGEHAFTCKNGVPAVELVSGKHEESKPNSGEKARVVIGGSRRIGKSVMRHLLDAQIVAANATIQPYESEEPTLTMDELMHPEQIKKMQRLDPDYQPRRNKSDRKRNRKNRWR